MFTTFLVGLKIVSLLMTKENISQIVFEINIFPLEFEQVVDEWITLQTLNSR